MTKSTPIFSKFVDKTTIVGVASSGYLYSVYTFLPDHIYDPLVTIVPTSGAISSLFLPRLLNRFRKNKVNTNNKTNEVKRVIIEQTNDGNQITVSEEETETENIEPVSEGHESKDIDESLIQELIDQKLATMLDEFNKDKQQLEDSLNTINSVRSEIDELKSSIGELKNAFETTLVDFKAFQTEIANPLNFMRKYFESIDIKNLSDPTLPLQFENKVTKSYDKPNKDIIVEVEDKPLHEDNNHNGKEEIEEIVTNITSNGLNITSYINNSMQLSDIMELVSSLGEFIEQFGDHYHNILSTQCKILGLDKEREELLYNIADTLSNSKTSADAYIESLYRLATVMGVKDEKVDTIYNRLMRSKRAKKNKRNKKR